MAGSSDRLRVRVFVIFLEAGQPGSIGSAAARVTTNDLREEEDIKKGKREREATEKLIEGRRRCESAPLARPHLSSLSTPSVRCTYMLT